MIHITIKRIIIGNTQSAHDFPGTSPEGPLKVLMSGTYKGPSGESQRTNTKIDDFMKKLFSRSNSPCITYLFLFFYRKNHYSEVLNGDVHGTSTGRPRDPVAGRPWDQMTGRSKDVRGTSVKHVF